MGNVWNVERLAMDQNPDYPTQSRDPSRRQAERVRPMPPIHSPSMMSDRSEPASVARFEPPLNAIGPMFRFRLQRIHLCRVPYELEINDRPTNRVLGGYYKSRRLVRVYARHERRPPTP